MRPGPCLGANCFRGVGFENDSSTRVADDTVKRLRKKLHNTGLSIETVWGYGFKVRESR